MLAIEESKTALRVVKVLAVIMFVVIFVLLVQCVHWLLAVIAAFVFTLWLVFLFDQVFEITVGLFGKKPS